MSAHPSAAALRAHGVMFVRDERSCVTGLRGPKAVVAAAAREIARRADLLAPQLRGALRVPGVPMLPGAPAAAPRRGLCLHCGEPLEPPFSDGGCDLCHAAIWRALRARAEAA